MASGIAAGLLAFALTGHGAQTLRTGTTRFEATPGGGFIGGCLGHAAHLAAAEVAFRADGVTLKMVLPGANPSAQAVGLEPDDGVSNYLIGSEDAWRTNVQGFRRVEYRDVYPGVDAVYYGKDGRLEYDFVVRPGGEPGQIRLRFEGAREVRMDSGDLILRTTRGEFRHTRAQVYQIRRGKRQSVAARLTLRGRDEAVFDIAEYDRSLPLTIDPVIVYSTYLGGSGQDTATSLALDGAGNSYITGWTETADFLGVLFPSVGTTKINVAFVAKFNAAGGLVYVTYIGGSRDDRAFGIAVDSARSPILAGWTYSTDFPTANAAQPRLAAGREGFLLKLTAAGNALIFSTFIGGSGYDSSHGVAVDGQSNIYVAGETTSGDIPMLNPIQSTLGGGRDAFVAKYSPSGGRQYATYLGGVYDDSAAAIALDGPGNAYLTGSTYSPNFPVANAYRSSLAGGQDAFVAKLNAAGNTLLYSTYLGGSGGALGAPETGTGIAVDGSGAAYVTGNTSSTNFPAVNAYQSKLNGSADAFLAKLSAAGNALVYSTYLGGSSIDFATGVAVDSSASAHVSGYTASPDFPVAEAVQPTPAGKYEAFLARADTSGAKLAFATYLGGTESDAANAVAVDSAGSLYTCGHTLSPDFPTTLAIQRYRLSATSAWTARIAIAPLHLVLTNLAITSATITFKADSVDLSAVTIGAAASVQVTAYTTITLRPEFRATAGAAPITFRAAIGP
jgi:hypothetical protein